MSMANGDTPLGPPALGDKTSGHTFDRIIPEVRVTRERIPFLLPNDGQQTSDFGTARANQAATAEHPNGTTEHDWADRNRHRTVLQQHCLFFDTDDDGVIWPWDTFSGFYRLGFGIALSLLAVFIIHANFSYATLPTYLPDPFFRVYVRNIHKDKHGSDTGTYDNEGRFIPQKFEDIFSKYADGRDYLTIGDLFKVMKGQRCIADPIGWGGALFEWLATYIMLWPQDGKLRKEDIRGVYDGSIFFKIAEQRRVGKNLTANGQHKGLSALEGDIYCAQNVGKHSILRVIHAALDYLLSLVRLGGNGEVGWLSLDRKNGRLMREQQPMTKKIKLLILFNPILDWIDNTQAMRLWTHRRSLNAGRKERGWHSAKQIRGFVEFYHINMTEFEPSTLDSYSTFEDFFVRHHTQSSRPIYAEDDPKSAVVVADSRVVTYESVPEVKKLWIKGYDFNITNLIMDSHLGNQFDDGPVASFRLSPQDYHRYHSPVTGTIKLFRSIPGDYYQVDPVALGSHVDDLTKNAREYVLIDTDHFGLILFVAIGATGVGTVRIHEQWQQSGRRIQKGDELGVFEFGGSSIIVAFQKGRVRFDEDLLKSSKERIQVAVEVGMSLGKAVPCQ